jgi:hypothetical protein
MKENGALQPGDQGGSNDLILGHMGNGPPKSNNFAGIKPKRRWRRPEDQFSSQGGQNDDKRGESRYLFTMYAKDAEGKKLRRLKTFIIKNLIKLINAS